jgi:hypothetical protein
MPRKICKGCSRELDMSMFHKHSQNGTRPRCKECRSKATKRFGPHSHLIGILEKKTRSDIANDCRKKYPYKDAAKTAKRRTAKKQATPLWGNHKAIQIEYELAAWCTKVMETPYEVDHIIPIQGKLVCGLHVENNLRVIPWIDNVKKGNNFAETY